MSLKICRRYPLGKIVFGEQCFLSSILRNLKNKTFERGLSKISPPLSKFLQESSSGGIVKENPESDKQMKYLKISKHIIKSSVDGWKNEFSLFKQEVISKINPKLALNEKGDIHMLFTFESDESIKKFNVTTDKNTIGGFSTAEFIRTQYNTGLFSGYIDTRVPKTNNATESGFASVLSNKLIKSFRRTAKYDWSNYSHLVLKIRGDGRSYLIILGCPGPYEETYLDQYHYPLYTRGGPYWQLVKIPFSNFYFTSKGLIRDDQCMMELNECSRIGFSVGNFEGPFKLEIEYIGLEFQPLHRAISPYESYVS